MTMAIVQIPQALALDTSLLAVWAAGWSRREALARELADTLLRSNTRLLIALEHLVELVAHGSDSVITERAEFVGALRQVYSIRAGDRRYVGSVLDIKAAEVRARLAEPKASYALIQNRARAQVLDFGEAEFLVTLLNWPEFRRYARGRIVRRRVVASIVHTKVSAPHVTRQLLKPAQHRVPLATALRNFDKEEQHLASQLKAVGDSRLAQSDKIARHSFDELRLVVREAERGGSVALDDALRKMGIEERDLVQMTSADILADKYVWKAQSQIIARVAGVSASAVARLRRSEMPSVQLAELISKCQGRFRRAASSDSTDASLACLSLYASVTSVDKRTAECVRQIRRKRADLNAVMGRVITLTSLEALAAEIHGWSK